MKRKHMPTVTIGIPAHNEEHNIGKLLSSIYEQSHEFYRLSRVIIISDGSTDRTGEIVREYQKKYSSIDFFDNKNRNGKSAALNKLYALSDSDYLLTIDADVVFSGTKNLDLMVAEMEKNNNLHMVGPLHIPTAGKTFFGNLARFSYLIIRDAALKIDDGNNYYGVMAVEFMKKRFYKSFFFPQGIISDQCYAYSMAIKEGKIGFKLVKEAQTVFGVAQSFHDWRVLSARAVIGDKRDVVKYFGESVLKDYTIPKKLLIQSLIKYFFKNPIYLTGSVLMNVYIRIFPYTKNAPTNGMWTIVTTSKELS